MPKSFTARRRLLQQMCLSFAAGATISVTRADELVLCRPVAPSKPTDNGPGRKFALDGSVQRYPGNTVICPIPTQSEAFAALARAYEQLRADIGTQSAGCLTWLPPDSYHMTVFDGVTNAYRRPGDWPQTLPLDASMEECNRYVGERLRKLTLGFEPPIRLAVDTADLHGVSTTVALRPIDEAENARLRELRDRISAAIGVRHAGHDTYRFHTSFAYYVRSFTADDEANYQLAYARMMRHLSKTLPVLELQAPGYCLFDDMFAFHEQFRLKKL